LICRTALESQDMTAVPEAAGAHPVHDRDLALGTFSDDAPWQIDPDQLAWLTGLDSTRAELRSQLPALTRPRRLPGFRVVRVVWVLGTAVAMWYLLERRKAGPESRAGISRRLRRAAERLGPAYIKLAQIISSGEGLFPAELVNECKRCRDQVPAESFRDVIDVVEQELGVAMIDVFATFDSEPLAAASIAQVHRATLRATGQEVVVKVQRPSVARSVRQDLKVMAWLAPFLIGRIPVAALANPPALVELFAETIVEELDFRLEAQSMLDVARSLRELGQDHFVVPRPHPELVTRRMLVMERLDGFAFDDVAGMRAAGVDTEAIVRTGMIAFLEGCMLHGIFHGDLHGGNLFVQPDGRTALLDFGITARMSGKERHAFLRLLVTATMNNVMGQLEALRDLGALPADTDLQAVIDDLDLEGAVVDPTQLSPEELIGELQAIIKQLLAYGARLPKSLMLFVKNLVFLDGAIATLAPDLDLFEVVTKVSVHFATNHGRRIAEEVGMNPDDYELDLTGMKASFGVDPAATDSLTYRELVERRDIIRSRLRDARA